MKNAVGEYVLGYGPFEELAECPTKGVAFYVNDFSLSAAKPWKVPTSVERLKSLPEISNTLKIKWEQPSLSDFTEVFGEVSQSIQEGEIKKSVPVVCESGEVTSGSADELIFKNVTDTELHAYAWVQEGEGFCGLTPEVLFSYEKGRLKTMALAGTASIEECEVFSVDEKEIREHEFVAQTLIKKLNQIGMVRTDQRRLMRLRSLVHFHTPIQVGLYNTEPLQALIERLHPTPALGPLPRNAESLGKLYEWRDRICCPAFFGAPMGIYENGVFHSVVCIRGVAWNANKVTLPAGCGVIEASRLTSEWRELYLKRQSVKKLFAI